MQTTHRFHDPALGKLADVARALGATMEAGTATADDIVSPVLTAARKKRDKRQTKIDELLATATAETRSLNEAEQATFEELAAEVTALNDQIRLIEVEEQRKADALRNAGGTPSSPVVIRHEEMTYGKFSRNSFLADLATIQVREAALGDRDAAEARMTQHHKEMTIEARTNKDLARALDEVLNRRASTGTESRDAYEQRVNPNTTFGTGGEFVPPLWAMNLTAQFLRPGRIFAGRIQNADLPPGIDVINVPKITLGALTAIQAANAAAVASQDIATNYVSAPVNTISGQQDVSLQLLEQSPLAIADVVFDDLTRDYNQRLDVQIVAGTGSNGQHLGLLNLPSGSSPTVSQASAVTVASATFWDGSTQGTQYRSVVKGVNQIETLTFSALPPSAIWAHPRRVNSWAYAADSATGRPLFTPGKYGQFNQVGIYEGSPTPEGVAGELFGLPVVKDANMPTTMNGTAVTGGTADPIIVLNESMPMLWEGALRIRALPEILSGTLQIRYQVYAYSAFLPSRFPQAVSILTGNTGLAAPGF